MKFTKIIAPALIAAIGLGGIAGSANAQPGHGPAPRPQVERQIDRHQTIRADIAGLRAKIDRAQARRTISAREANGLRRDAADIQRTYANYARGGLSVQETRNLQNRVDKVEFALRAERHDRNNHRR